jgi:uncharacterized protein YlzI (FlbEa/FlbD family)
MRCRTGLIVLLVFGFPSVVLADIDNRTGYNGGSVQRAVSTMSYGRAKVVNDSAKSFTSEQKGSFAAPPLVPSLSCCRIASSDRTKPWIKLTGPDGEPVYINVEQVTSVRSDTETRGSKTQLDLTSGKFQRVKEDVEQVIQLISATSTARENDETPAAALLRRFN